MVRISLATVATLCIASILYWLMAAEPTRGDIAPVTPQPPPRPQRSLIDAIHERPVTVPPPTIQPPDDASPSTFLVELQDKFVPDTSVAPGQLISGKRLREGQFQEMKLPRGLATVSVNLPIEGGSTNVIRSLDVWSRGSVDNAIRDIWNAAPLKTTSLRATFNAKRVFSRREAETRLQASGNVLGGMFSAGIDSESSYHEEGAVFVAVLEQIYYTASFHSPDSPAKLFAPNVTAEDFDSVFALDDPPCYVSDVHYGRYFALVVKSSSLRQSDKDQIAAGLNLIVAGGAGQVSGEQRRLIDACEIRAVALGGPPELGLKAMSTEGVAEFIAKGSAGGADSPAVAIAYTARYLKDNSIARVVRSYRAPPAPCKVRVTIRGFKLMHAAVPDDEEDLDVQLSVNGQDMYNVTNINHWVFGNAPGLDIYPRDPNNPGKNLVQAVELGPTSEVIIRCHVKCRDWKEPDYGTKEAVHSIPIRGVDHYEGYFDHEENGGRWKVEYSIDQLP